jgi:hypothetical protein
MRIKPKQGYIVRDPQSHRPLAEAGEEKPRTQYWLRRLRDGDVELIDEQATAPAKEA